ncbi:MAG: universal stress protein [Candidatus Sericytochromatia bacterium]|nr:universal stress protein [Candidatus Sericytochromatia bacterium]
MKVLITTDGSRWSQMAIRRAAALLDLASAEVHVLSVANLLPLLGAFETPLGGAGAALDQETLAAHQDAERALAVLQELGVTASVHQRDGDPAHEIVALARHLQADLIVLGAHAKHGLERLLLGSTSDAVLHRWAGATLVIRPTAADAAAL